VIHDPFLDLENSLDGRIPILEVGTRTLCFLLPSQKSAAIPIQSQLGELLEPFKRNQHALHGSKRGSEEEKRVLSNQIPASPTSGLCILGRAVKIATTVVFSHPTESR